MTSDNRNDLEALALEIGARYYVEHESFLFTRAQLDAFAARLQPARVPGHRVADLLHLLQFATITTPTTGDAEQAQKVMTELRALLAAHPAPEPAEGIAQSAKAGQAVPRMAGATISGCGDVAGQSEPAAVKQGEGREGVEADIQKVAEYLTDAGYPDDGDAQLTLQAIARRLSSAQQAGNRPATGTVADISDEALLRRAVTTVAKQRGRQYAWARIMDVFMLGSTYSAQLCRRFDIDPDTGKTTQRTGSRGEVGDA